MWLENGLRDSFGVSVLWLDKIFKNVSISLLVVLTACTGELESVKNVSELSVSVGTNGLSENNSKQLMDFLYWLPWKKISSGDLSQSMIINWNSDKIIDIKSRIIKAYENMNWTEWEDNLLELCFKWKFLDPMAREPEDWLNRVILYLKSWDNIKKNRSSLQRIKELFWVFNYLVELWEESDDLLWQYFWSFWQLNETHYDIIREKMWFSRSFFIRHFPSDMLVDGELERHEVEELRENMQKEIMFSYKAMDWTDSDDSVLSLSLVYIAYFPDDDFWYDYLKMIHEWLLNWNKRYLSKNSDWLIAIDYYVTEFLMDAPDTFQKHLIYLLNWYKKWDSFEDIIHRKYVKDMSLEIQRLYDDESWTYVALDEIDNKWWWSPTILSMAIEWIYTYPNDEEPYQWIRKIITLLKWSKYYTTNSNRWLVIIKDTLLELNKDFIKNQHLLDLLNYLGFTNKSIDI